MNKKILRPVIALLLVAIGFGWWWYGYDQGDSDGHLRLYGNVDMREVQLAINGFGRIAGMLVREGERVHKGQLLAQLDTDRLQAMADRAEAEVEARQAVVDRMLAGSRPEEISRARADLAAAKAQADDAAQSAERLKTLSEQDLASKQQADNAAAAASSARERVKAASQTLKMAKQGPRQEDVDAARAQLKASQAQLKLAQKELAEAELIAPVDGIIRNRILEPGDMASPQRPLYTLAVTDPLWVRTYLSESDLGRVREGMRAVVTTDSFPGKHYRGWIGYISPTAEFTPQSVQTEQMRTQLVYQLRVYVCNPEGEMRLGMPATIEVNLEQPQAADSSDPCHAQ